MNHPNRTPQFKHRTLGVLGGMGPAATSDFLGKLIQATPAVRDEDHIPTIVCSLPQIPSRSAALLEGGPSPLPKMVQVLSLLESCHAEFVAIPCNTAHYWYEELQTATSLPIVHIVDAVLTAVQARGIARGGLGLIATTATVSTGVYADRLDRLGFECLVPVAEEQSNVMRVIQEIKAGRVSAEGDTKVRKIIHHLMERGAGAVILGNSELPLALKNLPCCCVDATEALALACVEYSQRAHGD